MKEWLRRIRGAIGIGLTWAAGWAPIGALVGLVLGLVLSGPGIGLGSVVTLNAVVFATLGFVGGTFFSSVLRLAEGRRRFDELSLPRFAAWGAVGGLALGVVAAAIGLWGPGASVVDAVIVGVATLLGAGSAAGSLALARAADDAELLSSGQSVADAGLTEREVHELLGGSR